ncbi:hypothetical protein A2313_02820 [Candidatus Roizmanbacteria bacterium RIFOXYB2_FULL_41_10]|uniref:Fibronectin type-III domain-containing protein n=1 Tax=Candidatus Roizmanbacteria bacterium RIFOXYA1_FULL_41_12 TaxID=1802082 RepID=A0A1F7KAV4_9BACT|nr:MAG: hypothetical protein A2209_04805 [Candidatus Roizmanbacteria bacterium RIFOXYA1_FULL_41_12]OGK66757.1 MAG: hypothetical protein A2377_02515 [Candidatus Roizmanbacteria bacterium RIFOXYB1_FULL_41_27]OGK70668.1 MAG: hypothetical protein A2313_02820 [Candidatus Roizmanbacteria bacterium RIFOXYB2_FULL_41_10]OGK70869.1 MAG: hypothetical protein A2403_02190 [Candidatus Roizmanbacteria bacterium RIFOXYC1_FULL_41_16]OGK75129.1 MAG: hypothetical protein A2459_01915 [Candidatus Roizmanbacteria ba
MFKLKVKQVRVVTYILGAVASILMGILGFRFLGEYLTSRASDSAPKNLSITEITTSSAVVKWSSDQDIQVVIEYGTSPTSLTFFAPEATRTKEHRVELNLLTEATTYYFQIKSGDQVFDNGGVPWTFTTLSQAEANPTQAPAVTSEPTTTAEPTIAESTPALSPTIDPAGVTKDTTCNLETYKNRFYTDAPEYDQDNNGVVNLRDWSLCNAKATTTPTP